MADLTNYSHGHYENDGANIPIRLGLHETSAADSERGCVPGNLGTRKRVGDRVFYLGKVAAATVIGRLYASDTSGVVTAEITNSCTAAAIGATRITITSSTIGSATTDQYAGGYVAFTNNTGEGQFRRIRKNTAASSNVVIFDLYDPIETAIDTTTDVIVTANLWSDGVICDGNAGTDMGFVWGVSQAITTSTEITDDTEHYQWFQTWGPAVCLVGEVTVEGEPLMHDDSGTYDGGVDAWDVVTDIKGGTLGVSMTPATAAGDFLLCDLRIRP
jgi:hypothetical protein